MRCISELVADGSNVSSIVTLVKTRLVHRFLLRLFVSGKHARENAKLPMYGRPIESSKIVNQATTSRLFEAYQVVLIMF